MTILRRYNITADTEAACKAYDEFSGWDGIERKVRIKIDEVDNGEWVRYEDVRELESEVSDG